MTPYRDGGFSRHQWPLNRLLRWGQRTHRIAVVTVADVDTLACMVRIIQSGDWTETHVTLEQVASTRRIEPEVERLIDAAWTTAIARPGVHLFDGPMCRLESFDASADSLHLRWSPCSYRTFLGTNMVHPELFDRLGPGVMANPIGLSALVITADHKLLLGRRNDSVAYYPGRVHPIAGCLEPGDATPFTGIRRELREELNLSEEIRTLRCIGLIEDASLRQVEMVFAAEVSIASVAIERSLDATEHRGVWTCDATKQAIAAMTDDPNGFTPVARGALLVYAG